jgi:hypothetical protein
MAPRLDISIIFLEVYLHIEQKEINLTKIYKSTTLTLSWQGKTQFVRIFLIELSIGMILICNIYGDLGSYTQVRGA